VKAEKSLIRYGFHIADKVVVLSALWLKKITPFCGSDKITIIPNTVPQNAIKHHRLDKQVIIPHTILFMGVLGPRKGVYDLLDAIRILNLDKSKTRVRLCGNGEIEKVRNRVVDLGLEEIVEVPGWIDGEERRRSLKEAYLYVLPSYFEGLPMSILEALSTGTPVITTPVGGIPELITDGYNGFLVPTKSPQQLAVRIEQILNDKNLWKTMSDNALITIREKFTMEHAERKLRILYDSLAS
jgi:glycosyltransferase involved in cell wall biosynthesis